MNKLGLALGDHWGIVGMTGSGKTHFATDLLEYYRTHFPHVRRYVLDSTEDGMDRLHAKIDVRGNRIPDVLKNATYTQVWTPDTDVPDAYSRYLENILYDRKPAIVFIDEIASLTKGKNVDPPDGYTLIMKQGRKHGITVMSLTQEIAHVPQTLFKQMTHFALFRINNETYDMTMARKYLGLDKDQFKHPESKWGFKYKRQGESSVQEFASSQQFFRR